MLLNFHPVEVGRKEVLTVWTRWMEGANPDIWIEIGPAEVGGGGNAGDGNGTAVTET